MPSEQLNMWRLGTELTRGTSRKRDLKRKSVRSCTNFRNGLTKFMRDDGSFATRGYLVKVDDEGIPVIGSCGKVS